MTRRHRNLQIRGVIYRDADHAAACLGVTATTVRAHARAGTLDRVGLGLNGPAPMPVSVRGQRFDSPEACAAHFDVGVDHVYKRLAAGRPDDIGLPNRRGQYRAKRVTIGPVRFRSMAEASRELGFGRDYVQRAYQRGSKLMQERILAAAMEYAAHGAGAACSANSGKGAHHE
ncbi:hypothetical protein [Thalassovita aquimarina]|uniref:Uncharacterized protein n=1 Tax=Thalassovita aquimarina TaxID=2785917 RepID=A0ABS5HTM2_9RHOB|nr:hypothetical protein [Thalassovita aquimarina]MBR9651898.1 hypothetical protein [Thalassovita aquimarina]